MNIKDYTAAIKGLRSAEARHGGVLRGGHTDGQHFFYCGKGCWKVDLADVTEFKEREFVLT